MPCMFFCGLASWEVQHRAQLLVSDGEAAFCFSQLEYDIWVALCHGPFAVTGFYITYGESAHA